MATQLLIPWFVAEPWVVHLPFRERELVVQPFAVSVIAALFVGYVVAILFARKHDRPVDLTLNLALYLVGFAFPISYLLNGLFYQPDKFFHVLTRPSEIAGAGLGWSMYGGIIGTIIGALVWKWRRKASILAVGDSFAFAGPFGWTIARLGCFVTHDHPGRVSDFFLAVADYQTGAPPYEPRHDLGLYGAIVLTGVAITFFVLNQKPRKPGFYVGLLPMLHAPCRFMLDFLRAPAAEGGDLRYAGLTPAQYVAVILFVAGVLVMRRVARSDAAPS
ncbi:MAG: prolipoprotein diacylglyceryl transferase [Myxococcales bacterium]|nr:prolipoprotein diacylglyceryl transferase [Myxococcales bacterium]MDH3844092.1 prolipoprotein diacylglyceryl transferase [Myxococcales bacterium]